MSESPRYGLSDTTEEMLTADQKLFESAVEFSKDAKIERQRRRQPRFELAQKALVPWTPQRSFGRLRASTSVYRMTVIA